MCYAALNVLIFLLFFAFGARGATRTAATATSVFMFNFAINEPTHHREHRYGYNRYYYDIPNSHNYSFLPFFQFLKIYLGSIFFLFINTTKPATAAAAASHINTVHHQLPTV